MNVSKGTHQMSALFSMLDFGIAGKGRGWYHEALACAADLILTTSKEVPCLHIIVEENEGHRNSLFISKNYGFLIT